MKINRAAQLKRRQLEVSSVRDDWMRDRMRDSAGMHAYYQARLEEMQAQYDRLLSEIDDAKRDAQAKVYKTFQDDAAVLPSVTEGDAGGKGLSAEGGVGSGAEAVSPS